MKLIILAAGYATRLYPLTINQPKPLLKVSERPMIEHVIDHLKDVPELTGVIIISNEKFHGHFEKWASDYQISGQNIPITVVNDKSTDENNRLGAIGDMVFAMNDQSVDEDVIVVAGDNLFSQSIKAFGEFCLEKKAPVLGVYDVGRLEDTKKYSEVHTDMNGHITSFEEKPEYPTTTVIGIALYYYPKDLIPTIKQYVEDGHNADQPGRLVQWLYPRIPVFTWSLPGLWYDIGSKETLEEANRIFSEL
ncbi:nucleotidyltransferase family protein [Verrucomicrobia bacterium]|jgi:glucose-1-phosphate thymidylyltransferase|nr:nucleotidyltransferase family protein [Verrucomicrobiota bacterium]MDB4689362.1 nucleotidyltransferase family protein [Verrucomicrobiota bacterium]MDB4717815.1 nucleotidyltransferase family protein [Verrucomicrobiota bacterium]MDB4778813.1 nucleotidyltransferase family protein [Verrucomicrobiota bacterium]